jgi:hypothetical protein
MCGLAGAVALGVAVSSASAQVCTDVNVAQVYGGASIDPGVTDLGIHCDDCTGTVVFPFPVRVYGHYYTQAQVSSNGNLQFTGDNAQYGAECLPTRNMDTAIFPYWDDLTLYTPGDGVFTSETGVAPNRVFNIEWRAHYYSRAGTANFEVRFFEGSDNFEFVYGANNGTPYTIGVQKNRGELYRSYTCNFSSNQPVGRRIVWSEAPTGSYGGLSGQRSFPQGLTDIGIHCDDCVVNIPTPFPISFYHQTYNAINVSSNGVIQFGAGNASFSNGCLPQPYMGPALMAYWDDLWLANTGQGVFTNVSGTAPSRTFDVEWRAITYSGGLPIHFTVRFFEGLAYYELYYDVVQNASSATIGAQAGDERYGELWCNGSNTLANNSIVTMSFPPAIVYSPAAGAVAGTNDIGNHCDDCVTNMTLPFPVRVYGQTFASANVSSNGNIQFESASAAFGNNCLPMFGMGTTIFAHWDDLRTDTLGSGVFTRVLGSVPNRRLVIEWRATNFSDGQPQQFSAVLYEETPRFDVYLSGLTNGGASATVGVQNRDGSRLVLYNCNGRGRVPAWVSFTCLVPECVADIDDGSGTGVPDGGVTIDDLLYFLFIFEQGSLMADVDDGSGTGIPDGGVTIDDLLYFLTRFEAGC